MNALMLLFRTHLSTSRTDSVSLDKWISVLNQSRGDLWSNDKENVDHWACDALFGTIVDGYIMVELTRVCGFGKTEELLKGMKNRGVEMKVVIETLANKLTSFDSVDAERKKGDEQRHVPHENIILFLHHGLLMRNFTMACRDRDSGHMVISLRYFAVWFQDSRLHNYARETLHLIACLDEYWSPRYKQWWMDNCLVNPSGKAGGFMACDYLSEYVVREAKAMFPNNANEETLRYHRETISPHMFFFIAVREKMMEQMEALTFGSHSSIADNSTDVRVVADFLLRLVCVSIPPGGVLMRPKQRICIPEGLISWELGNALQIIS